jgi:cytochrome o ubiquinol oxidase subunit 2
MPTHALRLRTLRATGAAALAALLAGCNTIVMKPHGDVAVQQSQLIVVATALMLLIIVPVIAATLYFAWRYRQGNANAEYAPEWDHSTRLEILIWGAPLAIILVLGAITWVSTHKLDPYRPLDRIDAQRPVPAGMQPLQVNVVALDWKWLFIYPELGFATVNEIAAPIDRPIRFHLTASTVMNSFYIPALAGQIYAMPGMETRLHAVINKPGDFTGTAANYSGAGFSHMRFRFLGMTQADFDGWVAKNREGADTLTRDAYLQLAKPSERDPVRRYASVDPQLFDAIVNNCVEPGKMCMHDMMMVDARGGLGKGGLANVSRQAAANGRERLVVAGACTPDNPTGAPVPLIP